MLFARERLLCRLASCNLMKELIIEVLLYNQVILIAIKYQLCGSKKVS